MKITGDTMVPLSFFGALLGGVVWLSTMNAEISHATSEIASLKTDIQTIEESKDEFRKRLWDAQQSIDRRLSQIEGKIDVLVLRKRK